MHDREHSLDGKYHFEALNVLLQTVTKKMAE